MSSCTVDGAQEARIANLTRARALPAYAALAIVAAGLLLPIVRTLQPTIDEGIYLNAAELVSKGALPYRDFVEPAGPGSFYWLAMWFRMFGGDYGIARGLLLLTGVGLCLATFRIARQVGSSGFRPALLVLVTTVPSMVMNSPHYDSNLVALCGVAVFLSVRSDRSRPLLYALAGLLIGLADVFAQGKGFCLLLGLVCSCFIADRRGWFKAAVPLICGWIMPPTAEVLWFAEHRAFRDLLYATFWWPMSGYTEVNAAPYGFPLWDFVATWWSPPSGKNVPLFSVLLGLLQNGPMIFIACVPVLALGVALIERKRVLSPKFVPLWFAAFALLASELHRRDLGHLVHGTILLTVLFFTICERSKRGWIRRTADTATLSAMFCGVGLLMNASRQHTPLEGRRGTLLGNDTDRVLQFLVNKTKPGDQVFAYPYKPLYYFWADVTNPTRFSILLYGYNTDAQFREAIGDLERKKVRWVLWDESFSGNRMRSVFPSYSQPPVKKLLMEPYLTACYHEFASISGVTILERNEAR